MDWLIKHPRKKEATSATDGPSFGREMGLQVTLDDFFSCLCCGVLVPTDSEDS